MLGVLLVMAPALGPSRAFGAAPAATRARVSISEFQLEGAPPPALGIQLQDGFVLGMVRGGTRWAQSGGSSRSRGWHPIT